MSDLSSLMGTGVAGAGGAVAAGIGMAGLVSARLMALNEPPEEISCRINPTEFTIQKNANLWTSNQIGDAKEGVTSWNGPSTMTLSVSLIFDDTGLAGAAGSMGLTPPVALAIPMLLSWTEATPASVLAGAPASPIVNLSWGAVEHFAGHVEGVNVTYKLFMMGVAVRAEVDLTMRSVSTPLPGTNPTSGGMVPRKGRTVVQGDSLASIAYGTYGKAAAWRSLAEANDIDDPTRIPAGTQLLLPDRSEVEIPRR